MGNERLKTCHAEFCPKYVFLGADSMGRPEGYCEVDP